MKLLKLGIMFIKSILEYSSPVTRCIVLLEIAMTIRIYYGYKRVHVISDDVEITSGSDAYVYGTNRPSVYKEYAPQTVQHHLTPSIGTVILGSSTPWLTPHICCQSDGEEICSHQTRKPSSALQVV